jgi:hypothetical protein
LAIILAQAFAATKVRRASPCSTPPEHAIAASRRQLGRIGIRAVEAIAQDGIAYPFVASFLSESIVCVHYSTQTQEAFSSSPCFR